MDFDAEKMMQIISNLLSNSIKFTLGGGDISLLICKEISNNNNQLIIKVKDTGIGIPVDKLPNIFDRFYKVDNDSILKAGHWYWISINERTCHTIKWKNKCRK